MNPAVTSRARSAILTGLAPDQGAFTIAAAVTALLRRREELSLGEPWSVAELRLEPADYEWLRQWAENVTSRLLKAWLSDPFTCVKLVDNVVASRKEALGLLLIVFAAETGRRLSSEGQIWPAVFKALGHEAQHQLFVSLDSQPMPSTAFRLALEAAVLQFGLRHRFGQPGQQAWYATIFLQFGFTCRGFERNLPKWLAMAQYSSLQIPDAIASLKNPDDELHSPSFKELWEKLYRFGSNNVSEESLRTSIRESCWVLAEWEEPLVLQAKKKRPEVKPETAADGELRWIAHSQLRWLPGERPELQADLINLPMLEELEPGREYLVLRDGVEVSKLLCHIDGGCDPRPARITLPWHPLTRLQIVRCIAGPDDPDPVIKEVIHQVWDPSADVLGWDRDAGMPLALELGRRPAGKKAVVLLVHDTLMVLPKDLISLQITDGWKLFQVPPGQLSEVQVCCPGTEELLWEGAKPTSPPAWEKQVRIIQEPACVQPGDWVEVRVQVPNGIQFSRMRIAGSQEAIEECSDCLRLRLTPERLARAMQLTIWTQEPGKRHRVVMPWKPVWAGAIREGPSTELELIEQEQTLDIQETRRARWRIALPLQGDRSTVPATAGSWAVYEGFLPICTSIPERFIQRPLLIGLGASLELLPQSAGTNRERLVLVNRVVDQGCIKQITWDARQNTLLVQLRNIRNPEGAFHLLIADESGHITKVPVRPVDEILEVDCSNDPVLVLVELNSNRLGCWWNPEPPEDFWHAVASDSELWAFLFRWGWAPVMSSAYRLPLRKLVNQRLIEMLPWMILPRRYMSVDGLLLLDEGPNESWLGAVRGLIAGWTPMRLSPPEEEEEAEQWDQEVYRSQKTSQLLQALGRDLMPNPQAIKQVNNIKQSEEQNQVIFSRAMAELQAIEPKMLYSILHFLINNPYCSDDPFTDARGFLTRYAGTVRLGLEAELNQSSSKRLSRFSKPGHFSRNAIAEATQLFRQTKSTLIDCDIYLRRIHSDPRFLRLLGQQAILQATTRMEEG